jgi:hypothetical protein
MRDSVSGERFAFPHAAAEVLEELSAPNAGPRS